MVLVINFGEYEFTIFMDAVHTLEMEYGYEGEAWEMVVASEDLEILGDFLDMEGFHVEMEVQ
ncbi:hypothetical protein Goe5_c01530 [Bacillus phage vB_BthM-Goe5]|nr:hypothetical protein Goe5_c01530 [Bacillus phage vB_BthM-Goe5]